MFGQETSDDCWHLMSLMYNNITFLEGNRTHLN